MSEYMDADIRELKRRLDTREADECIGCGISSSKVYYLLARVEELEVALMEAGRTLAQVSEAAGTASTQAVDSAAGYSDAGPEGG